MRPSLSVLSGIFASLALSSAIVSTDIASTATADILPAQQTDSSWFADAKLMRY